MLTAAHVPFFTALIDAADEDDDDEEEEEEAGREVVEEVVAFLAVSSDAKE